MEKYSWKFWLGVIFLLALLGFNLFTYAGDIVEYIDKGAISPDCKDYLHKLLQEER